MRLFQFSRNSDLGMTMRFACSEKKFKAATTGFIFSCICLCAVPAHAQPYYSPMPADMQSRLNNALYYATQVAAGIPLYDINSASALSQPAMYAVAGAAYPLYYGIIYDEKFVGVLPPDKPPQVQHDITIPPSDVNNMGPLSSPSQTRQMLDQLIQYSGISVQQHTGNGGLHDLETGIVLPDPNARQIHNALRNLRKQSDQEQTSMFIDIAGQNLTDSGGSSEGGGGNGADVSGTGNLATMPGVAAQLAAIAGDLAGSSSSSANFGDGAQVPIAFLPIYQNDPLSNFRAPSSAGIDGFSPTTGQYFLNGDPNNNIGTQYPNTNIPPTNTNFSPPAAALCGR